MMRGDCLFGCYWLICGPSLLPLTEIVNGDGQQFYHYQQKEQPQKNSIEKKLVVLLTVIL
jgi:hypothetical protein